jgi:outer membrane protein assembly factor BamB
MGTGEETGKAKDVDFCAFEAQSPAQLWEIILEKADGGSGNAGLKVWCRGGKFGMAWIEKPSAPGYAFVAQAAYGGFYNVPADCGLVLESGRLKGAVYRGVGEKYVLDAAVNGGTVSGTYQSETCEARKGRATGAAQSGPKGTLKGRILGEAELKKELPALPEKAAYPCWRNTGSGLGFETGAQLVSDPSKVRVLWKSEDLIPPGYHEGINFGTKPCGIQSGHASPILAEGKVFLNYFTGSAGHAGDDKAGYEEFIQKSDYIPNEQVAKKIARLADQIMVCLDAQTGRTLWKFVAKEDGPNVSRGGSDSRHKLCGPSSKAASHLTSCYGAGKVFFKGTGGVIYCLDAKTGAQAWKDGAYDKAAKSYGAATDTCQFADGVMATGKGGGLTGFDATSGKELWTIKGAIGGRQTHLRWVCDGKEYFITPRGQLVEPKSGKLLWTADFPPSEKGVVSGVISVGDGYLLHGGTDSITCYRVTLQEAKRLWTTKEHSVWREIHPVIYQGHAYVRAVTKANQARSAAATYCFELQSGKITGQATGTKSFSSVIGGDGRIFNCNAALVILQSMDPAKFADLKASGNAPSNTVADVSMPIILQGHPETTAVYADGRLFTRTFDGIVCYDLRAK